MAGPQPDRGPYSEQRLQAAVEALSEPQRFAEAERLVAQVAPGLQKLLASTLAAGWFGEAHDAEALKAATRPDPEERISAVRTLLAEEARMAMMVGVAVGWALQEELSSPGSAGMDPDDEPTEGDS